MGEVLVEGFELLYQGGINGATCSYVRSRKSGLVVIVAEAASPIISLSIVVPTQGENDRGAPHCLEHLVFRGSEKFAAAGYLDSLASLSLSSGTNAYTAGDRTAYTASFAGQAGLLRLLPAYLNHVLHPLLTQSDFDTEVFSVSPTDGASSGVVLSEMEAFMADPDVLANALIARQAYADNCAYRFNTGGIPSEIPELTNTQIITAHKQFYRPEKIAIIAVGQVSMNDLLNCVRDAESQGMLAGDCQFDSPPAAQLSNSIWCEQHPEEPLVPPQSTLVASLAGDNDTGDAVVTLGWRGPKWSDYKERLALECVGAYLVEGSAAPFNEFIVEDQASSLASSVDMLLSEYRWPTLEFTFQDCPSNTARDIKARALQILVDILQGGFDMVRMTQVIQAQAWEEMHDLEDSPHSHLDQHLCLWFVNCTAEEKQSEFPLGDALSTAGTLQELQKEQDPAFWINILKKYLIDRPCYEVILFPSTLHGFVAAQTDERLRAKRLELMAGTTMMDEGTKISKDGLLDLLSKEAGAIEAQGNIKIVAGKCYAQSDTWRHQDGMALVANPLRVVDMCVSKEASDPRVEQVSTMSDEKLLLHSSQFFYFTILSPVAPVLLHSSLWSFLNTKIPGRKKSLFMQLDMDVREYLQELRGIDFEARWKALSISDPEAAAAAAADLKDLSDDDSDSYSASEESDDLDDSSDFDDWCSRGLLFVLENFTCGQLMYSVLGPLIFESDLHMPSEKADALGLLWKKEGTLAVVEAKEVQTKLGLIALEFGAGLGIGSSSEFQYLLSLTWKTERSKFAEAAPMIRAVLDHTVFTVERLAVILKKTLARCNDRFRAGEHLVYDIEALHRYKWESSMTVDNLILSALLCRVVLKYPEVFIQILESLYAKAKELILSRLSLLSLIGNGDSLFLPSDEKGSSPVEALLAEFPEFRRKPNDAPTVEKISTLNFAAQRKPMAWEARECKVHHLVSASIETTHIRMSAPINFPTVCLPASNTDFSIVLKCFDFVIVHAFLVASEGPIFQPVRDSGAAYAPAFSVGLIDGLLQLRLCQCSKPALAIKAVMESLSSLLANLKILLADPSASVPFPTRSQFEQAKSAAIHVAVTELDTPNAAAFLTLENWLRNLPKYNDLDHVDRLSEVTWEDFLNCLHGVISTFMDFENTAGRVISTIGPMPKYVETTQAISHFCGTTTKEQVTPNPLESTLVPFHIEMARKIIEVAPQDFEETEYLRLSLAKILQAKVSQFTDWCSDDEEDESEDNDD